MSEGQKEVCGLHRRKSAGLHEHASRRCMPLKGRCHNLALRADVHDAGPGLSEAGMQGSQQDGCSEAGQGYLQRGRPAPGSGDPFPSHLSAAAWPLPMGAGTHMPSHGSRCTGPMRTGSTTLCRHIFHPQPSKASQCRKTGCWPIPIVLAMEGCIEASVIV